MIPLIPGTDAGADTGAGAGAGIRPSWTIALNPISFSRVADRVQVHVPAQKASLRILQVTDLHFSAFGPLDRLALHVTARKLARRFNVDIVACTGDVFGLRTVDAMKKAASLFDQVVGTTAPWLFAWGNHDQELRDPAQDPLAQLDLVEEHLERLPHCMYKRSRATIEASPGPGPRDDPRERDACILDPADVARWKHWDGFYGGNYLVEVVNAAGEVTWNLFVLNSRRSHHVPPKALHWMRDRIIEHPGVPSICFYHVPNWEYYDIWERGIARGIKRENVCFEKDRGQIHAFLKNLGSIKACFVGHDHVNDYHGVLDGIDYVYGRKTSFGGYGSFIKVPAKFKEAGKAIRVGGKLITLKLDAATSGQDALKHVTVFHDGTTWTP